jgi:hypothetical protein
MPWVPIDESPYSYSLGSSNPAVTVDGGTVSAGVSEGFVDWDLIFTGLTESVQVRVTIGSYFFETSGSDHNGRFGWFNTFGGESEQQNENLSNPVASFDPSPVEMQLRPTPGAAYFRSPGFETSASGSYQMLVEVWVDGPTPPEEVSYNCECDDPNPSRTLAELRRSLMIRLGFSAQTANPPPGMVDLLNDFLQGAQRNLYRQYTVLRTERFFTWALIPGVRFYDLAENEDECTKELDPRMITWAGLSDGPQSWRPLICGIPPECYTQPEVLGWPTRYEIRQCIELWPAPSDDNLRLRIKGHFGLEPFEADDDQCTIDDEAVFLYALARAKAHYRQPDAANYQTDAMNYIRNMTAGKHQTRRYVPGEAPYIVPPPPLWTPLG